jgi:hypothetical protein
MNLQLCRVCGWDLGENGWERVSEAPNYVICACCGGESGVDDVTPRRTREYRAAWVSRGCPWFDPSERPVDWNPEPQLELAAAYWP